MKKNQPPKKFLRRGTISMSVLLASTPLLSFAQFSNNATQSTTTVPPVQVTIPSPATTTVPPQRQPQTVPNQNTGVRQQVNPNGIYNTGSNPFSNPENKNNNSRED